MTQNDPEIHWLDYFSGGVPTGGFFSMTLEDLTKLVDRPSNENRGISRQNEVCLIGLTSYFEAFFKDHFASLINIEPTLLHNLAKGSFDTNIDILHLLEFKNDWHRMIGFLIAEKLDFGTPKKINSNFSALLKISPFGTDDSQFYEKVLADRNLIVHHGGTYTRSYLKQHSKNIEAPFNRAYLDAITVDSAYLDTLINFTKTTAQKTLSASYDAMVNHVTCNNIQQHPTCIEALSYLQYPI